jgi:ADP-ribosylglycohydrolase
MRGRQRGALIGLAVGDALGAAVEFMPPGMFPPVTGYRGGGWHGIEPGEWTDDTSMALALADSIASVGWDPEDQMRRYGAWFRRGEYSVNGRCFDIGVTTAGALKRHEAGVAALECGDRDEYSKGNGSVMRLAPVAIRYAGLFPGDLEQLARLAGESSQVTHATEECVSACRYLALLLCGLLHGVAREAVLAADWPPLQRLQEIAPLSPPIAEVAAGSFRQRNPPAIQGSGYVVQSLEAALWAFAGAADFRHAVLRAVNLGLDADTTGAVCGQLSGACWGESGIPPEWRQGLARADIIEGALDALIPMSV